MGFRLMILALALGTAVQAVPQGSPQPYDKADVRADVHPRVTSSNPLNESFDEVLTRIEASALAYRELLPSLTADEAIDTWVTPPAAPFKHHVALKASFRIARSPTGAALQESRQILQIDGQPYLPTDRSRVPMLFDGAFSGAESLYFRSESRHCLTYTVAPGLTRDGLIQLFFSAQKSAASDPSCASLAPGLKGNARIHPLLFQILHVERTIPTPAATQRNSAAFSAVDYASTQLGDQTVWLPAVIVASTPDGTRHFVAHYSNYRRSNSSPALQTGAAPKQ